MTQSNQKPSHIVYFVKESNQKDSTTCKTNSFWTRIGAAWTTTNGHLNTKLDLIPNQPGSILIVVNDDTNSR